MNLLTKRLPTILALLLLLSVAGGMWWWVQNTRPIISEENKPQKVRITNVADNKFAVSWVTSAKTVGAVEYGQVGGKLDQRVEDERGGGEYLTHSVTVAGLQPATQYAFRIVSGETKAKFDNNGSPYSVTTGKVLGTTPPAESFYGQVQTASGKAPEGALVYVALPSAQPASTLVTATGGYAISLSTVRNSEGTGYVQYDPATTVATVTVEDGQQTATAAVTVAGAAPVPTITMGQQHDFRAAGAAEPAVAEVRPETPTVFNVEPIGNAPAGTSEVTILNPGREGEEVATTLPEFRGIAPSGTQLVITVHSTEPYSDTLYVGTDGTWEWTPPTDLSEGEHTITIAYIDTSGIERILERTFFVSTALAAEGDPAFEATPSGGTTASPSPSVSPSPSLASSTATTSASPRVSNPSTESGVPVTGVAEFTLLTASVGLVIMVLGALLLAL